MSRDKIFLILLPILKMPKNNKNQGVRDNLYLYNDRGTFTVGVDGLTTKLLQNSVLNFFFHLT